MREIAAQVGVSRVTVGRLRTRHGWRRPRPARETLPGQRGGGHPFVPEIVAEARALIEGRASDGTPLGRLSFKEIAARTGVSRTTLCRWGKRGRWQRPRGKPPAAQVKPFRHRRGAGRPYGADALGMAQKLLTTTLLSQKAIARQVGVCQAQISVWMRKRGWARPAVEQDGWAPRYTGFGERRPRLSCGARRFAAAKRQGPLATEGDRRGRPYAPEMRREARALYELSRLSTVMIGARVGAHRVTVARWAKEDGWTRPRGRAGRAQLRGYFGVVKRGGG